MEFTDVEVVLKNGTVIEVEEISTHPFYFCNQDSNFFPPLPADQQGPDKWMDEGQERLLSIYGWTCVVFLVLYCILVLGQGIVRNLVSLFWGTYEVCVEAFKFTRVCSFCAFFGSYHNRLLPTAI